MIVSHNELVVSCSKAFAGLNLRCGEADLIGNMVVDLEMVGLDGVKHFIKALEFLPKEQGVPVHVACALESRLTANLNGCSLLCHLPTLLDYTLEKLIPLEKMTLHIEQCHNRWLGFGELAKLAKKGLSVEANWSYKSPPNHVTYRINAQECFPNLYLTPSSPENPHSLTIEISKNPIPPSKIKEPFQHITPESLQKAQQLAWEKGILINKSDWNIIKQAAHLILVESTAASFFGAGEESRKQPLSN